MKHAGLKGIAIGIGALLLCAAPATAQTQSAAGDMGRSGGSMPGINLGGDAQVDEAVLEKRRAVEKAYRDATRNTPSQAAAVNDPWANMRGPDEQKPAAKPVARTAQKKKPAR